MPVYQSHHMSPNMREHGNAVEYARASEYQVSLKLTDKYAAKFGMEENEVNPTNMSLNMGGGIRVHNGMDPEEEVPTRDKVNQVANKYGSQMQESKISLGAYQRASQTQM